MVRVPFGHRPLGDGKCVVGTFTERAVLFTPPFWKRHTRLQSVGAAGGTEVHSLRRLALNRRAKAIWYKKKDEV